MYILYSYLCSLTPFIRNSIGRGVPARRSCQRILPCSVLFDTIHCVRARPLRPPFERAVDTSSGVARFDRTTSLPRLNHRWQFGSPPPTLRCSGRSISRQSLVSARENIHWVRPRATRIRLPRGGRKLPTGSNGMCNEETQYLGKPAIVCMPPPGSACS